MGNLTKSQQNFFDMAVQYMQEHYNLEEQDATVLMDKYIRNIQVGDATVQHLGPDYFAIQILMQEKRIPYQPM